MLPPCAFCCLRSLVYISGLQAAAYVCAVDPCRSVGSLYTWRLVSHAVPRRGPSSRAVLGANLTALCSNTADEYSLEEASEQASHMRSQFVPLTTMVLPRKALPTAKPKAASAGAAAASQSQPLTSASPPVEVINIEDNKEENRAEKEGNSISSQGDSRKRSRDTRPTRDNGATKVKRPASLLGLSEEPTPDPSSVIRSSVIELSPVLAADPTPVSFLTWNANGLMPRVRASQWVQFAKYANEVKPVSVCMQCLLISSLFVAALP